MARTTIEQTRAGIGPLQQVTMGYTAIKDSTMTNAYLATTEQGTPHESYTVSLSNYPTGLGTVGTVPYNPILISFLTFKNEHTSTTQTLNYRVKKNSTSFSQSSNTIVGGAGGRYGTWHFGLQVAVGDVIEYFFWCNNATIVQGLYTSWLGICPSAMKPSGSESKPMSYLSFDTLQSPTPTAGTPSATTNKNLYYYPAPSPNTTIVGLTSGSTLTWTNGYGYPNTGKGIAVMDMGVETPAATMTTSATFFPFYARSTLPSVIRWRNRF